MFATTREGELTNFESVTVNGSNVTYTNANGQVSNLIYNAKTGMISQAAASLGTHIKHTACIDFSKCQVHK